MWVGWVIEGLLLSASLPPQLADLIGPSRQGKFCWALKLKQTNKKNWKKIVRKRPKQTGKEKAPKPPQTPSIEAAALSSR